MRSMRTTVSRQALENGGGCTNSAFMLYSVCWLECGITLESHAQLMLAAALFSR